MSTKMHTPGHFMEKMKTTHGLFGTSLFSDKPMPNMFAMLQLHHTFEAVLAHIFVAKKVDATL